MRSPLMSLRPWWPRWPWPSGCGRPAPAWPRITWMGLITTSTSSISMMNLSASAAVGWAERCQRATEDIPRLLRPRERPQGVPKVSPLSPALLQPQVTVVATLGKLLATLPRQDEEMLVLMSPGCLYWDLEEFTNELRVTLYRIDDSWWHRNVTTNDDDPRTSHDGDPVPSLSQALAACRSTPGTAWDRVTMAARKWHRSVAALVNSWAQLARAATELRNTCRNLATEAADWEAFRTSWARELQAKAARDGTAQEHMGELGQALGREEGAEVVAGGWRRPWGLLERLVAACDGATAFPRELQRRAGDIEATLKGTIMGFFDIPEDLVAKVAEAERLWEANARLAKDHLLGTLQDIISFYFDRGPTSARGVAERCQRATEDIPRLLQVPECPQSVPKICPVSLEPQELSPALLQPQVTVVATLGELLATLPRRGEMMLLPVSTVSLYWDLVTFTESLRVTLYCTEGTWWHRNVTSHDGDPLISLSQALAACRSTRWTTWDCVTMAASKWQRSVSVLVKSWAQLARAATELRNTCRNLATQAADREAFRTREARELQAEAARDGTAQEHMGELGQALGREEGAEVVAGHEAQELERRVGDIEAALKWTNEGDFDIPEALVAKVAEAERLWEANAPPGQGSPAGGPFQTPSSSGSLLLEALVSTVATLGEVTATVTGPRRGVRRCVPPKLLHAGPADLHLEPP
uniref:uncharacterized protein LOC129134392 n=1 Tax=Agelaius phoeniceus TaxID=39638 RepID=UPI0023EC5605|nr:uncharacterized protein LOC129134392 [Agelaius phoeniceus]